MPVNEHAEFLTLFEDSVRRRVWLLYKALECNPLDRALDLARLCDDFVTEVRTERGPLVGTSRSEPSVASPSQRTEQQASTSIDRAAEPNQMGTRNPTRLTLSAQQREKLLDCLARGGKNAELAAKLGLTTKQVQGIRMGCAREIALRRTKQESTPPPCGLRTLAASVDEVIRYLRQQDDVVVPQEGGKFLVNARFRLQPAELVSRANRMRARQGKPEFELQGQPPPQQQSIRSANGHPLFWSETPPVEPTSEAMSSI